MHPIEPQPGTRAAAIVWFRRDLRLSDNPALDAAIATGLPVVPVWIESPEEEAPWAPGAATMWWLRTSLAALRDSLRDRGVELVVRRGPAARALERLCAETGARDVYWNRRHEPAVRARDEALAAAMAQRGIAPHIHPSNLLFEPDRIASATGAPYRVFAAFWRNARQRLRVAESPAAPAAWPTIPALASEPLDALLADVEPKAGFAAAWNPGEAGGAEALDEFVAHALARYPTERDPPATAGTSRLSPHLHFGEITPSRIVAALARHGPIDRHEKFLAELGWREFAAHLLFHFPSTSDAPFESRFERFEWREDPDALAAWQRGRTGIPFVDAGMRQLLATGWMHNRVRMVAASFLSKNLRIDWREGARWFWQHLVDADLANNTLGWQWSAGSGVDAAPYFRIFNPVTQGERYDPGGAYVRRWVSELANVPASHVHRPWTLPEAERRRLGVPEPYARPIVDLAASRADALAAYQRMREG